LAQPRKTVTALRPVGRGRVAVDLDGERWRVVPQEAAYRAGLVEGLELDRNRLRLLRRELRKAEALEAALGSLRHRDHTRASLAQRLERRGVSGAERERAVETVARAGLVDDARFAHGRAAALAARGAGNDLIAADLEQHGLPYELVETALAGLEPESERALRVVERRGRSPRTLRFLAGKGFTTESLDVLIADMGDEAVG
jgi:SOS response regulatory protein OraA/RecX